MSSEVLKDGAFEVHSLSAQVKFSKIDKINVLCGKNKNIKKLKKNPL
jgi:hypothetical protein